MVFTRFSGHSLPWPWPLTQKLVSTSTNQNTCVTKIGWYSFHCFWDTVFTRFSGHWLLWPRPLTFWLQNLISTSANPNTSVTKFEWNSLYFLDMVFTNFGDAQTNSRTHSLTDGQTRIQYTSGTVFQTWRKYTNVFTEVRFCGRVSSQRR